jgi:hypothetical protein
MVLSIKLVYYDAFCVVQKVNFILQHFKVCNEIIYNKVTKTELQIIISRHIKTNIFGSF